MGSLGVRKRTIPLELQARATKERERLPKNAERFEHLTKDQTEEIERRTVEEWEYWKEMDKEKKIILPWVTPSWA